MDVPGRPGEDAAMDLAHAAAVAAVFLAAGAVKGVTGMGLPTVAISLLGLWMAPAHAAAILVAPSLATNIAQCRGPHARRLVAQLWPLWAALVAVVVALPDTSRWLAPADARRTLGIVLIVYGAWGLWRPTLPRVPVGGAAGLLVAAVVGALTGLVTACTAIFALPMVPYLQALRLDKDTMIQALGLSFLVATIALALRLGSSGLSLVTLEGGIALVAAFAGLGAGAALRARISGADFQRALFVVFIALGAASAWRGG